MVFEGSLGHSLDLETVVAYLMLRKHSDVQPYLNFGDLAASTYFVVLLEHSMAECLGMHSWETLYSVPSNLALGF